MLRNNKRYTTIDTRKDGIRFNNSTLRQLNEQFQTYRETYNNVQSKLANEVIKVAGAFTFCHIYWYICISLPIFTHICVISFLIFAFIYISLTFLVCIYVNYTSFLRKTKKLSQRWKDRVRCGTASLAHALSNGIRKKLIFVYNSLNFMYSML